jgi:hypothetical protein
MGKHSIIASSQGQPSGAGTAVSGTRSAANRTVSQRSLAKSPPAALSTPPAFAGRAPVARRRSSGVLPLLASFATAALVLVIVVDPYSGTYANAALPAEWETTTQDSQTLAIAEDATAATITREAFDIKDPPPPPPPVVVAAQPKTGSSGGGSSSSGGSAAAAPAAGTPDPGSAKAIAQQMVADRGWDDGQYNCLVSLWNKESGWNMYASNKSSGAYGIPQALPGSKMATAGADWATNASTQITWGLGYISGRYQTPCGAWTHSQAIGWY